MSRIQNLPCDLQEKIQEYVSEYNRRRDILDNLYKYLRDTKQTDYVFDPSDVLSIVQNVQTDYAEFKDTDAYVKVFFGARFWTHENEEFCQYDGGPGAQYVLRDREAIISICDSETDGYY